jgi:hypothetical protein
MNYLAIIDAEFAPNLDDALFHDCVGLEAVEGEPEYDTVPGALRQYFAEEGGVYTLH